MLKWEKVTEETTRRLKVPLGWLVRTREYSGHTWGGGASDSVAISMCFIFDPFHWWKIDD